MLSVSFANIVVTVVIATLLTFRVIHLILFDDVVSSHKKKHMCRNESLGIYLDHRCSQKFPHKQAPRCQRDLGRVPPAKRHRCELQRWGKGADRTFSQGAEGRVLPQDRGVRQSIHGALAHIVKVVVAVVVAVSVVVTSKK